MKRKAPTPTSSAHLYVISDTETDPEDDRPELKSKRATAKGRKSTLDVIAISSDESEQDCEPPAKKTPTKAAAAEITKIESIDNNCLSQPLSRHSSIRSSAAEAIRFKPEIGIKRLWKAAHNRITKQNRWPFTHSTKRPTTETPSHASLQDDPGISDSDCEGDFDDEYDYNDDYLLGGELEIAPHRRKKPPQEVDYADLMNKSYHRSCERLLAYQEEIIRHKTRHIQLSGGGRRPRLARPPAFSSHEMSIMFAMVAESNHALRPVDWDAVASEVSRATGGYRHASECLEAFESSIQQHKAKSQRIEPDLLTRHSRTSIIGLLGMRERGRRQPHVMKDLVLLKKTHNYGHATTFNFSSGSVVDMAFKESSLKVAVANVATQDIYNRTGNLLLCDFKNGVTRHMNGHEKQGEILQKMAVTVNDIKLSYSKEYFISGADDRKTMIWNSETGEHITTLDDSGASITRLAIMEHSLTGEDVFAASSCYGVIDIYSLDEYGQVKARNKQLAVQGGRRGISSLSFGYGFFWDCLAVGMEGMDNGLINEGLQGGIAFYDANTMQRVADGDLTFRHVTSAQTARSVSCLSFSASGEYLVCGTSGRTSSGDDEQGDGFLRVFDVRRAKETETVYTGHVDVNLVDFSPCQTYVISCSHQNEVAVFDRRFLVDQPLHRLQHLHKDDDASNAGITSALWWPSGTLGSSECVLASGGGDGAVRLWDIRRATEDAEVWHFDTNVGPIARMVASRSFEHLIVGADTGSVSAFTLDHDIVCRYENKPMTLHCDENMP